MKKDDKIEKNVEMIEEMALEPTTEKAEAAITPTQDQKPSITAEISPEKVKIIKGNWNKYNPFVSSEFYESTNSNSP